MTRIFSALVASVLVFSSLTAQAEAGGLTYDLGASTGKSGNQTYTEANLGLSYFAADWLAWRNSLFGRFRSDIDPAYGLDTSLRLTADVGDSAKGFTLFLGPGYRFASGLSSSPFAEAGLVLHAGGLSIGGGAKQIYNSAVHKGEPDELQYFVTLGGGGRIL